MRHFVVVGILVVVMAVLTYFGLVVAGVATQMHPIEASLQSVSIDWLWHWEIMAISFLFSLIIVPMIYSMVVFRRKKGDTTDAEHMEGNTALEITWTVIPLIVVLVLAYMGAYSLGETRRVDPNAIVVKVKAQQFTWTFEYPNTGIISKELHLPVNQQVVLQMESADVIHSFWVPEFRVKQDVVPGRVTEYRITPTLVGTYKVRCAELCGMSHYAMESLVLVDAQADYTAWINQQTKAAFEASQSPEGLGKLLVVKNGCIGCHSTDGLKMAGPTWFEMYGATVTLADGSTVTADDAYLKNSILNPKAQIVNGFSPIMPAFALSDADVANIIAYFKTLK